MRTKTWMLVFLLFFGACSGVFAKERLITLGKIQEYSELPEGREFAVIQEAHIGEGKVKFIDLPVETPVHANVVFESDEGGQVNIAKYGSFPKYEYLINFLGLNILKFEGPFTIYLNLLGEFPGKDTGQYYRFVRIYEGKPVYSEKLLAW